MRELILISLLAAASARGDSKKWSFDAEAAGAPPAGFSFGRTGSGAPGRWTVQLDKTAPSGPHVLAQLDADDTDYRFPVAVASEPSVADLRLSVRCKPVSGKVDQACGLVFRYRDENNYYVTRANALENNVRLYYVKDGKRKQFAGWNGKVASGSWHELRVDAEGDRFQVYWDGNKVIDAADKAFSAAGKVGLWTKADSVTHFDDLTLTTGGKSGALDGGEIEKLTGAKGKLDEKAGAFKVSVPRSDLSIKVAGVRLTPPMGLTSWAAFDGKMVMGDLVLLEDQVNPVMSAALDAGLDVTALHNHFFWDQPKVMFMHIGGTGETAKLAGAVGTVFAAMKEKGAAPRAEIDPAKSTLDPEKIDAALGHAGEMNAGVYKVVVARTTSMHGHEAGGTMGVNTWAAFAGSDDKAVVDGDFAMLESELQSVLKALRAANIDVVAIHQHMTGEEPRILFLHYWGVGRTEALARGLRVALDQTKHK